MIASQIVRNFSVAHFVLLLLLNLIEGLHETRAATGSQIRTLSWEDARWLFALGATQSSLRREMLEYLDAAVLVGLARLLVL